MNIDKRYNIVILNHHASTPDVGGGGRHYDLAKQFSEMGYTVDVIASSYDNGERRYYYSQKIVIEEHNSYFRFIWLKTKPAYKNSLSRFLNYLDYMMKAGRFDQFNGMPNVIIASSVHPLAWIAGYRLSRKYRAKFIVEVRDLWPLSLYEDLRGIYGRLIFTVFELIEKRYYSLADSIVTTMPYAYEYIEEKYNVGREKITYIPHGIDIEQFDLDLKRNEEAISLKLKDILDKNFCVTYTGALSRSEGLDTLIEAAKYLMAYKDIRIVILGCGTEEHRLRKMIEKDNLVNVVMVENQNKYIVPVILNKSNILLCGLIERKAFKYGISKNKFYDYMAAGKPIIFASSVRESLIDKAEAGITIEPGNAVKLSESILYLYKNMDTIGKEYGEKGRAFVEKNHSCKKITGEFIKVISSIM